VVKWSNPEFILEKESQWSVGGLDTEHERKDGYEGIPKVLEIFRMRTIKNGTDVH
jgi:hypothetical protein